MWAIIENGGKQYKVSVGDVIEIEKIEGKKKDKIDLQPVLMISDKDTEIGTPEIKNAKVKAEILDQGKSEKVTILKHKAKKRYKVKRGHRQSFTSIKILDIKK